MFRPGKPVQAEVSFGAAPGTLDLKSTLEEAADAGNAAAIACGFEAAMSAPVADAVQSESIMPLWLVPSAHAPGQGPKQFIDLQNDVGASDIKLACPRGFPFGRTRQALHGDGVWY